MNGSSSFAMDLPALICPLCDHQLTKPELFRFNLSSFTALVDDLECPNCGEYLHPEDGFLRYLQTVPSDQAVGLPLTVGGSAAVGTKNLEVGKTEEVGLFGGGGQIEIDRTLQAETDLNGGLLIEDLQDEQLKWYNGRLLVDDFAIVNIMAVDEGTVAFITSQQREKDTNEITIAYNIQSRLSSIVQPPWVDLLGEAAEAFYRGRAVAEYPLIWASLENLIGRELARTLRSQGKTQAEIDQFFNSHRNWYDRCNDGLCEVTGHELESYNNSVYSKLDTYRGDRNDHIVHVDPDDGMTQISIQEMKDIFETAIDATSTIFELCHQERTSC